MSMAFDNEASKVEDKEPDPIMRPNGKSNNNVAPEPEDDTMKTLSNYSLAELEMHSLSRAREEYEESALYFYLELFLLCVISCVGQLQRSAIGYMMDYSLNLNASVAYKKMYQIEHPHGIKNLTLENYALMNGPSI